MATVAAGVAKDLSTLYSRAGKVYAAANKAHAVAQKGNRYYQQGQACYQLYSAVFVEIQSVYDLAELRAEVASEVWLHRVHGEWLPPTLVRLAQERLRTLKAYLEKRRSQLVKAQRGGRKEALTMLAREAGELGTETYMEKVLARLKDIVDAAELCQQHICAVQSEFIAALLQQPPGSAVANPSAGGFDPRAYRGDGMQRLVESKVLLSFVESPHTGTRYVLGEDEGQWVLEHNPALRPGQTLRAEVSSVGKDLTHLTFSLQVNSSTQMAKETAKERDLFTLGRRWVPIAADVPVGSDGHTSIEWKIPQDFFETHNTKGHGQFSLRATAYSQSQPEETTGERGDEANWLGVSPGGASAAAADGDVPASDSNDEVASGNDGGDGADPSQLLAHFLDKTASVHCDSPKFAIKPEDLREIEQPPELSLQVISASLERSLVKHTEWKTEAILEFARPQDGGYYAEYTIGSTRSLPGPVMEWGQTLSLKTLPPGLNLIRIRLRQTESQTYIGDALVLLSQLNGDAPVDVDIIKRKNPKTGATAAVKRNKLVGKGLGATKKVVSNIYAAEKETKTTGKVVGTVRIARLGGSSS